MDKIYTKHSVDLNKWVNVYLDCIESRIDCKKLISDPVKDTIEYDPNCLDSIVDYCGRNPFYMNLFCSDIFKKCLHEQRTYVGESDLEDVKNTIIRSMGETNFSHFWFDNPIVDEEEKQKQAAENAFLFSCISLMGCSFESVDDIFHVQERIGMRVSDKLTSLAINEIINRLRTRGIISKTSNGSYVINLPIFSDWLTQHAELRLLPKWEKYRKDTRDVTEDRETSALEVSQFSWFPIPEDDLLEVSQNLVYCGKQKDVSELRLWLKQFDDDIRIEIAFSLLKRLGTKGFITEGAKLQCLSNLEDALNNSARTLETEFGM